VYLCLDVGNTKINGVIFKNEVMIDDFRVNTKHGWTSDQLGIFLLSFFNHVNINVASIMGVGISSVVPSIDYILSSAVKKYIGKDPFFVKAGVKTGISIRYKNPSEIGADLICGAVAATSLYPNSNIIVADLGTATTLIAINSSKEFLGGIILPGIGTQMNSLSSSAEKLSSTPILNPHKFIGSTSAECMQSGIYNGHLGAIKHLISGIKAEQFNATESKVIATGGFSKMFFQEKIFDAIVPDLVHQGILICIKNNLNSIA
jgi:type III pantothenate kinase